MDFSAGSSTFAEKMSNPAFMSVCFEGERCELKSLMEYFDTIEEASQQLVAYIGKSVAASWEALNLASEKWKDDNPDTDWPINVNNSKLSATMSCGNDNTHRLKR